MIDASELASIDEELVEEANAGIECGRTSHILEGVVSKLKDADLMIDKRLECTKLRFEEMRSGLKS